MNEIDIEVLKGILQNCQTAEEVMVTFEEFGISITMDMAQAILNGDYSDVDESEMTGCDNNVGSAEEGASFLQNDPASNPACRECGKTGMEVLSRYQPTYQPNIYKIGYYCYNCMISQFHTYDSNTGKTEWLDGNGRPYK